MGRAIVRLSFADLRDLLGIEPEIEIEALDVEPTLRAVSLVVGSPYLVGDEENLPDGAEPPPWPIEALRDRFPLRRAQRAQEGAQRAALGTFEEHAAGLPIEWTRPPVERSPIGRHEVAQERGELRPWVREECGVPRCVLGLGHARACETSDGVQFTQTVEGPVLVGFEECDGGDLPPEASR